MGRFQGRRPNPLQWVWYAFGGKLPADRRDWVLHDVTARTRGLRHAIRTVVLLSPVLVVCLMLPGPLGLRLSLVLMALLVGLFYSLVYLDESGEHRLVRHGFPHGTGAAVRAQATAEADAEATRRYLAAYRTG
ncbi:DUF5313 family protein [Amycolatopsis suaedae]|uniref:DUF5313 domain-containing protein n=1 Tax=Amycolatopsis suaedae TaxID=2510978 RepID=A0A4Q7JG06_9PSEU|nr:DUF5313 family protein [Amycolatopsis suaedae]RZQ65634.1 hypothetical protein EWH70_00615 [Amycolatopsis suaedae]